MSSIASLIDELGPLWLLSDLEETADRVQREILVAGYIPDPGLRQGVIRSLIQRWMTESKARLMDAVADGEVSADEATSALRALEQVLGKYLDE